MKKIMIVGASILQLPAIKKAKEMGLKVVAVDMNPEAIGFKETEIECEVISTIDTPAVVEAAKRHRIDGIMTLASDMPMRTIAAVAKELGLVGISEETALKATNKAEMRDALVAYGVPVPIYFRASDKDGFVKAINAIRDKGFKCIVKPADNSGSRGVNLLENYDDESINEAFRYSKQFSRSGELIVEEYMEGPEVSVETLIVDGSCHVIQITDKVTTGAPYFVEMGHSQPTMLDSGIVNDIREVAEVANIALGIKNGPSHIEIKITPDGPKIVELGARLGGDNITTHLVPLSTGVNMVEACIRIALGEVPDISSCYSKGAAIRYFQQSEGILKDIQGVEIANQIAGIKQISFVHNRGEYIANIDSSGARIGFVIAQGNNASEAIRIAEDAVNKIKLLIE